MTARPVLQIVIAAVLVLHASHLRSEEKESLASKAANHLFGYAVDKFLLDPLFDKSTGQPDMAEINRELEYIASRDRAHSQQIYDLQRAITERMTREEVKALIMNSLEQVDARLASQARQIHQHQSMLDLQQNVLSGLRSDVNYLAMVHRKFDKEVNEEFARVNEEFARQSGRTTQIEQELARVQRDYPRWTPQQQAALLGAAGMELLTRQNHKEALRVFRAAHGFDPGDAGHLYGLALAYRADNEEEFAKLLSSRAIALERKRPLAKWYRLSIERFQGPRRVWLEEQRYDPIYGVFVPGLVQVPSTFTSDKPSLERPSAPPKAINPIESKPAT